MLLAKCRVGCQLTVPVSLCVLDMLIMTGLNVWGGAHADRDLTTATAARDARELNGCLQVAVHQARRTRPTAPILRPGNG